MDLHENWDEVRNLFRHSFNSSFHYAVATVSENGEPHVTPIGSLILGGPGIGFYFEKFPQNLPRNLGHNNRVCVLAVNSGRWFWLRSLIGGKFLGPPAVRLYGIAGELRAASKREIALWQGRVKRVSFSKGHALMWREMNMVREIRFTHMEPVHLGKMTLSCWQGQV
jgi:hypothetical protein